MKKNKKLLIAVGVGAAALACVWYWRSQQTTNAANPDPNSNPWTNLGPNALLNGTLQ